MVIPISGQYEQQCNAAALEQMGINKLDKLDDDFTGYFNKWVQSKPVKINYDHSTEDIIANVMKLSVAHISKDNNSHLLPDSLLYSLHNYGKGIP